ncbi:SDR family oxidoreductase [Roseococcus sp. SYP-B2431]|uniref:SDR family NAD(P)-dependent oxidoreductase n=1 Tax=Roseococcus sp. SYP-B2431 TaxID=2496640 RepID=UPI001039E34D|nr:SDR family NAD(P)-dependent oxidoreductase [Roseococcus sp. SYP-B2431]TCH97402.1 SDR family oxidoreductase [Roseococcus sp. SYP-B2431]
MGQLEGRVAVVTGGARGIGLAIAERLSRDGARVALWDADVGVARSAAAASGAHAEAADVTDAASLQAALARTEAVLGPVDIMVANAGITGPNHRLEDYPVDDWRRVIEVDLVGVYLTCRCVVPGMRARNRGRIVNIASIAGKEGNPMASAYSAAKAGVIGLTKSLGKELAGTEVRVNCITPAAVETELFQQMTAEQVAWMKSKIPLGRFGLTSEVAEMAAFLASDAVSFSTGAIFDCSGGRAVY